MIIVKEGETMDNKKIIKFPVGREEFATEKDRRYQNYETDKNYMEIEFSSKQIEEDFAESMRILGECIKNIDSSDCTPYLEKAIALSKYNVDARVFEIFTRDISEFEVEHALIQLKDEAYRFEEGFIQTSKIPINFLHFKVCNHLADFYISNKLYNKISKIYLNPYIFFEMDDEFVMPMYYNYILSSLILNNFEETNRCYKIAHRHDKNDDEVILLSKVFYHLMQGEEKEAIAFYNKAIKKNKYILDVLDRIANPNLIKFSTDSDEKYVEALRIVMKFDYFFSKEYYFDFFMYIRESEYVIGDNLDKYAQRKEVTVAEMKQDRSFMAIRDTELKIMHENFLLTKEDFLKITKSEFLKIKGLGKGTIRNLHLNGVMFADDSEFDIQMELMEDDLW